MFPFDFLCGGVVDEIALLARNLEVTAGRPLIENQIAAMSVDIRKVGDNVYGCIYARKRSGCRVLGPSDFKYGPLQQRTRLLVEFIVLPNKLRERWW